MTPTEGVTTTAGNGNSGEAAATANHSDAAPTAQFGTVISGAVACACAITSWVIAASAGPVMTSALLAGLSLGAGLLCWRAWRGEQEQRLRQVATVIRRLAAGDVSVVIPPVARAGGFGEITRALEALRETAERGALSLAERDRLEQQLRMLWLAVAHSPASIQITDANGIVEYVNSKFTEVSGYDASEAIGKKAGFHKSGRTPPEVYNDLWQTILGGEEWQGEFYNRRKDGSFFWERTLVAPIKAADGVLRHFIAIKEDVTERKDQEIRIWQRAHFDALTDLPNRVLFEDRMTLALARARRTGRAVALLYLDLDQFKQVNDTLGHDAGDALLQEASTRLRRCVRESDTVSRVGGDEFILLLTDIARDGEAADIAHRVIRDMRTPFALTAGTVEIGASIGIAMFPRDGDQPALLLKNADMAMYWSKRGGRNTYRFFSPNPDDHLDYYSD